jgi:isoleucyl-tRNA synthetase
MEAWPEGDPAWANAELIAQTAVVQRVVSLGRAARSTSGHRVRQPLGRLLLRVPDESSMQAVKAHGGQILDELNVKALEFIARDADLVSYRIKPNLPRIGKRHGKLIPAIREALAATDGALVAAKAAAGESFSLEVAGETIEFAAEDVLVETASAEGYTSAEEEGFLVALDTRLDEGLLREGLARELVRTVQEARKQAGLQISDRISLNITGSKGVESALETYREFIMAETLAMELGGEGFDPAFHVEHSLGGENWRIDLAVHA